MIRSAEWMLAVKLQSPTKPPTGKMLEYARVNIVSCPTQKASRCVAVIHNPSIYFVQNAHKNMTNFINCSNRTDNEL